MTDEPLTRADEEQRFFKYMTFATAMSVLARTTLRWSTPRTLNDPFDVQFDLGINLDRVHATRLTLQKLWDAAYGEQPAPIGNELGVLIGGVRGRIARVTFEEFEGQFGGSVVESLNALEKNLPRFQAETREIMADTKLLCLTVDPANFLLWTHYADQHRGVVLQFRSVRDLDSPWKEARGVRYVDDLPLLMDMEFLSDLLSGRANLDVRLLSQRLIYSKSAVFAYENEWRIASGAGRDAKAPFEDLRFHPLELEAVIFGARIGTADETALRDLVASNYDHAKLFKVQLHPQKYGLVVEPA